MTTSVFYDPGNQSITVAVDALDDVTLNQDSDGTVIFTFEGVEDIEFYTEEGERLWRAVE